MQDITNDYLFKVSRIQHINSIGAVIDNSLLLHAYGSPPIDIQTIRRAEIFKTKNMLYNVLFGLGASGLAWTLFIYSFTTLEIWFVCGLIAFLLGCAYFVRNSKYVLFIRTMNMDYMEFEVNNRNKDDAKKIVRVVNRKIRQLKKSEG